MEGQVRLQMSFLEMSESIDMITTENKVDFLVDGKWGILGGLMGPISISAELLIELTFLEGFRHYEEC